ncbi:hypothetical protein CsatB_025494 [Cannabis sativa]
MSLSKNIIFFFFFLFLFSISLKTTFGDSLATVHIISNPLPKNNTNPKEFRIEAENSEGRFQDTLKWGGKPYIFDVKQSNSTNYLQAFWGRFIASIHVYEPQRDIGHNSIYWLVKTDGFYLSWDNSSWVQNGYWDTEI